MNILGTGTVCLELCSALHSTISSLSPSRHMCGCDGYSQTKDENMETWVKGSVFCPSGLYINFSLCAGPGEAAPGLSHPLALVHLVGWWGAVVTAALRPASQGALSPAHTHSPGGSCRPCVFCKTLSWTRGEIRNTGLIHLVPQGFLKQLARCLPI